MIKQEPIARSEWCLLDMQSLPIFFVGSSLMPTRALTNLSVILVCGAAKLLVAFVVLLLSALREELPPADVWTATQDVNKKKW